VSAKAHAVSAKPCGLNTRAPSTASPRSHTNTNSPCRTPSVAKAHCVQTPLSRGYPWVSRVILRLSLGYPWVVRGLSREYPWVILWSSRGYPWVIF